MKYFILVAILSIPSELFACSCIAHDPNEKYDYVYIAELKSTEKISEDGYGNSGYKGYMEIEKILEGEPKTNEVEISPMKGTSCQIDIEIGERYVIYGFNDNVPLISMCSRSMRAKSLGL
ncbi:hypothetical protein NBRC116583_07970 [Arenicella sp. 4NH20-0111]|uniref:hypothetical protein n=1 Tax=Arenicella sp. 4NH20-0111 TaxID=3127648 RepID=UPI0031059CD1